MRAVATLIIIVLAALPAVFAGWPGKSPGFFASLWGGVPGSVAVMSLLMLAFVIIAAICGVITRKDSSSDAEGGQ